MNIKEAKNEIIHTLAAYLRKDERGAYLYPLVRQRPILLIGPPGIGKTAIMEQVAKECQVGLVAYTITHHTRQSAVGLPKIVTRTYGNKTVDITEYTMSEIIASVYECMEKTGKKEGILFIDEINCVSETLAPAMLQFLQNKTFGTHKVPEGWVIVAAGNPPEYNKSVREFDIVTLDRVRKIEIQAQVDVWLEYARKRQVHGAILSYLEMKKDHFYKVENTVDGKFFVTARGWEDLSEILKNYEALQIDAGEELVGEFLQEETIARDFTLYYQLYQKYKQDYQILEILEGRTGKAVYHCVCHMAGCAQFEERFTVVELMLETLHRQGLFFQKTDERLCALYEKLLHLKSFWKDKSRTDSMKTFIQMQENALQAQQDAELFTRSQVEAEREQIHLLQEYLLCLQKEHIEDVENGFSRIRQLFEKEQEIRKKELEKTEKMLENAFGFVTDCFGEGQELLLLETGILMDPVLGRFLAEHGCKAWIRYSNLLLYKKKEEQLVEACRQISDV